MKQPDTVSGAQQEIDTVPISAADLKTALLEKVPPPDGPSTTHPIDMFIMDQMDPDDYGKAESFVRHLESAVCAHGSWGGTVTYTSRTYAFMRDEGVLEAVGHAIAEYCHETGEDFKFETDLPTPADMLTFAIDWRAGQLARLARSILDGT